MSSAHCSCTARSILAHDVEGTLIALRVGSWADRSTPPSGSLRMDDGDRSGPRDGILHKGVPYRLDMARASVLERVVSDCGVKAACSIVATTAAEPKACCTCIAPYNQVARVTNVRYAVCDPGVMPCHPTVCRQAPRRPPPSTLGGPRSAHGPRQKLCSACTRACEARAVIIIWSW